MSFDSKVLRLPSEIEDHLPDIDFLCPDSINSFQARNYVVSRIDCDLLTC
jgi:hypothetical protein